MARPKTKKELLDQATTEFHKLGEIINSMTPTQQEANFTYDITGKKEAHWARDKNLRDVLIHVYEWQQLLLHWLKRNMDDGENTPFLPAPYKWNNYADMNVEFWKKHQQTSLNDAKSMLLASHKAVIDVIESLSEEVLFTKAIYPWVGSTNIASYCISATCAHYTWAIKKLKLALKG